MDVAVDLSKSPEADPDWNPTPSRDGTPEDEDPPAQRDPELAEDGPSRFAEAAEAAETEAAAEFAIAERQSDLHIAKTRAPVQFAAPLDAAGHPPN